MITPQTKCAKCGMTLKGLSFLSRLKSEGAEINFKCSAGGYHQFDEILKAMPEPLTHKSSAPGVHAFSGIALLEGK